MTDDLTLAVAKAINGPWLPVPEGTMYTLEELRDIRWGKLSAQEQGECLCQARAAITALNTRVSTNSSERVVEALAPFALASLAWPHELSDDHNVMPGPYPITLGNLRAAHAARQYLSTNSSERVVEALEAIAEGEETRPLHEDPWPAQKCIHGQALELGCWRCLRDFARQALSISDSEREEPSP